MRSGPATADVHLCLLDSLLSRTEAAFFSASCCSSLMSTWAVEVTSGQVGSDTRTCRWYEPGRTPSLMLSSPEVWFSLKNLPEGTCSELSAAPRWQGSGLHDNSSPEGGCLSERKMLLLIIYSL